MPQIMKKKIQIYQLSLNRFTCTTRKKYRNNFIPREKFESTFFWKTQIFAYQVVRNSTFLMNFLNTCLSVQTKISNRISISRVSIFLPMRQPTNNYHIKPTEVQFNLTQGC